MLTELTQPTEEPISLVRLKHHLRVDETADDGLILQLALAARQQVENVLDFALVAREWRLVLADWPEGPIVLNRGPVQRVIDISVLDGDGNWKSLQPNRYSLYGARPGLVTLTDLKPDLSLLRGGVRIDFVAGFGGAIDVPGPLLEAISLLTANFYERRETFENNRVYRVPEGVAALLAPYRRVRV